jgi:hypothetical protein
MIGRGPRRAFPELRDLIATSVKRHPTEAAGSTRANVTCGGTIKRRRAYFGYQAHLAVE